MKLIVVIIFFCAFQISCNDRQGSTAKIKGDRFVEVCGVYPFAIDSLKLNDLFDSARWMLFVYHCDSLYQPKKDTVGTEKRTFGMLRLKFDTLLIRSDTVELYYNFMDGDQEISPYDLRDNKFILNGVAFSRITRKRLYMMRRGVYSIKTTGKFSRFVNPLQKEVLNYIDKNWNEIDSCFRELSAEKGLGPLK